MTTVKRSNGKSLDRGLRGDFLKITITVPSKMLVDLKGLGLRRRVICHKDTDVPSPLREAMADLLRKKA